MTSPLLKITPYDSYKAKVDSTYDNLKDAWRQHVQAVQALKDSNTWRDLCSDWKAYCKEYLPFAATTYSSYAAEIPFADLIEAISGAVPTANAARKVRESLSKVCEDAVLTAQTYDYAYRATGNPYPSHADIQKAYEEVSELAYNQAIEIGGEQIRATDAITLAVAESIREAKLRQKVYIQESSPSQKWTVEIASFEAQKAIQSLLPVGMKAPAIGSTITLLWKKEAE